ncbi:hypothetical protein DdX_01791 [Ditylenchus destructor]|uniref:Uncharacterized protein n=1 Tax=Ditylenchus destructor TaxID=166010 RepID=A0AAD4RE52_9BILA|nr:hypothetical protein DdX_01791 [Ditylenchus destructor]
MNITVSFTGLLLLCILGCLIYYLYVSNKKKNDAIKIGRPKSSVQPSSGYPPQRPPVPVSPPTQPPYPQETKPGICPAVLSSDTKNMNHCETVSGTAATAPPMGQ